MIELRNLKLREARDLGSEKEFRHQKISVHINGKKIGSFPVPGQRRQPAKGHRETLVGGVGDGNILYFVLYHNGVPWLYIFVRTHWTI